MFLFSIIFVNLLISYGKVLKQNKGACCKYK